MLRDLVRICTPRLGHVGIFHANDVTELLDPQPSMAELFEERALADTDAKKLRA
jgi:hypothetical protein